MPVNNIQKKAEEKLYISSFLDFYLKRSVPFKQIEEITGVNTPDAYIPKEKILIEVKKVIDEADTSRSARWGSIVNNLQEITNSKLQSVNVGGTYSINTPWDFILPRDKHDTVVENLLQAIKENKKVLNYNGLTFQINKINDKENFIAFSSMGPAGSYDAAANFSNNIKANLPKANTQLAYKKRGINPNKKILLLVNKDWMLTWDWDLYKGIASFYVDLLSYTDIDEIWMQFEKKNKYSFKLLFKKKVFTSFEKMSFKRLSAEDASLLGNWFQPLFEMGEEKRSKLLYSLEYLLKTKKPYQVFKNINVRIDIIKFGDWLLSQNLIDKTVWLINKFIDDPNPKLKSGNSEKEQYNPHNRILEGEDVNVITSVQGHLAWLVKNLATHSTKDDISNLLIAFSITKNKLSRKNKNLYLVQQWLYPLIEISNRRIWIANINKKVYRQYRKLILDPNNGLIKKYARYKGLARNLVNLLYYFKDLTTKEALFALRHLISAPEIDAILVFFAFYRDKHYKKDSEAGMIFGQITPEIFKFSTKRIQKFFIKIIHDPKNDRLKDQIAWQFWKILKDSPNEFCHLLPWANMLMDLPYDREIYSKLEMIIEDWYGRETECDNPSHRWLMDYVNKASNYVESVPDERVDIWLSIDVLLNKVAELHPEDLKIILENLYKIWMKNGYIGQLNEIFNSYKSINNTEIRRNTLDFSKMIYSKMKSVNPNIEDINFN